MDAESRRKAIWQASVVGKDGLSLITPRADDVIIAGPV